MDHEPMSLLVGRMIAAADIRSIPARTPWPLHSALRELHEAAGRAGLREALGFGTICLAPCPEVGQSVKGADAAIRQLVRAGLLRETGVRSMARLEVDLHEVWPCRRSLMRLDAASIKLLQRAGERWAALAATATKYASTPVMSSIATVESATA